MKVKVTGGGIYGAKGEIALGTIIEIENIPLGWKERVTVVENGKKSVTNPKKAEDDEDEKRDKLRADYLELTGKKADGRWSVEKLTEELEKAAE